MTRRRGAAAAAVVLVLAGVIGWVIYYSSAFGLDNIEVVGGQSLSAATIQDVLAIAEGTPLARVDLGAAETVLEGIPQVESASVSRDWPGTLVVQLTERRAIAAVDIGGTTWLLDRFGVRFAQVSAIPDGVVVLQVERPGPDDRATAAGIQVIQSLDSAIRQILVRVAAPSLTEIELELTGERTVIWGSPDSSARKSQILVGLLAGGVVGTVYDVSSPTSAVIR